MAHGEAPDEAEKCTDKRDVLKSWWRGMGISFLVFQNKGGTGAGECDCKV